MTRFFKISFLAMLCVVLVAGTAMAGSISFTGANSPVTVALEAMNAARTYSLTNSSGQVANNAAAITIVPSLSLATSNLVTVTFTNAGFIGDAVALCAVNNATPIAVTNSVANSTTILFQLTGPSGSTGSSQIFITDDPGQSFGLGAGNCNATNGSLAVKFQPVTSAQAATVSYTAATSGNVALDSSSKAVNVATFVSQFVTNYVASNSTIDYISNAANGSQFTSASNTATASQVAVNSNTPTLTFNAATGATVSAILNLQDTANWQGVKDVYVNGSGACSISANNAIVSGANNLTGTLNLAIPGNAFNGTATYAANVCVDVLGNAVLTARTISGSLNVAAYSHTADAYHTLETWVPNGYQGIIPYLNGNSTYNTICIIGNQGTGNASVKFSVLSAESGATLTGLQNIAIATLTAGQTARVDINSAVTPYTYSGGTETAGTGVSLTGLASNDRFTGQFNIAAAPSSVTVNCIQTDTLSGVKRAVPVLQNNMTPLPTGGQWIQ